MTSIDGRLERLEAVHDIIRLKAACHRFADADYDAEASPAVRGRRRLGRRRATCRREAIKTLTDNTRGQIRFAAHLWM